MDSETRTLDVVIKKEPLEALSPRRDDDISIKTDIDNDTFGGDRKSNGQDFNMSDSSSKSSPTTPLRYISRRGRPPGGGYSMKSHSPYLTFGSSSLISSADFGRQSGLGQSSSALSPHDLMKTNIGVSLETLDTRGFGLHSFRCEGCDVVFSSRDTYAMHMLLRAKNESCVALPTSAISANPENPTPREKFEREMREKAMMAALRNQAALMSKAAAVAAAAVSVAPKNLDGLSTVRRTSTSTKDDLSPFGGSDISPSLSNIFGLDAYGLYMDANQQRQYKRLLSDYGFRSSTPSGSLSSMTEQLSCSVCGELFTTKDALAMHMMFHTREIEKETKPFASRRDATHSQSQSGCTPPELESTGRNNDRTSPGNRQEKTKNNGDRQLTAERIAELKRMAIESSLRSSMRKQTTKYDDSHQNVRSRSVSEDNMIVTSSAQTRPLSADDAMKISQSVDRSIYNINKASSMWEINNGESDQAPPRAHVRKRNRSVSDYTSSSDSFSLLTGAYSRRKYFCYDDPSLNAFTKDGHLLKSTFKRSDVEQNAKVCDNHVSSASGPQDSDETSNGSSTALEFGPKEHPASRKIEHENKTPLPSLENIMSSDTILVPVDNLEEIDGEAKFEGSREKTNSININSNMKSVSNSKAIDFSVAKRDDRDDEETHIDDIEESCGSYIMRSERHQEQYNSFDPNTQSPRFPYDSSSRQISDSSRQLFVQQHQVELVPDAQTIGRSTKTSTRSSMRNISHSAPGENAITDTIADASSRVGEARYCPHCEILFLDVTIFHLHMGLHNVNNPWQCNTCGIVCSGRLEFNTHVLHY